MIGRGSPWRFAVSLTLLAAISASSNGGLATTIVQRTSPPERKLQLVRVAEMVRGVRFEVSVVPMTVRPLLVVTFSDLDPAREGLSFEEQATALDRALGQLERDKHLPPKFDFQPGSMRPELLALLGKRLSQQGANWNGRTGTARRGDVYASLSAEILAVAKASPLAAAFGHHGYTLQSRGVVSRVEVGKLKGFGSQQLPTEIGEMGLVAGVTGQVGDLSSKRN